MFDSGMSADGDGARSGMGVRERVHSTGIARCLEWVRGREFAGGYEGGGAFAGCLAFLIYSLFSRPES